MIEIIPTPVESSKLTISCSSVYFFAIRIHKINTRVFVIRLGTLLCTPRMCNEPTRITCKDCAPRHRDGAVMDLERNTARSPVCILNWYVEDGRDGMSAERFSVPVVLRSFPLSAITLPFSPTTRLLHLFEAYVPNTRTGRRLHLRYGIKIRCLNRSPVQRPYVYCVLDSWICLINTRGYIINGANLAILSIVDNLCRR